MNLSKREKVLLSVLLMFMLVYIYYSFMFSPLRSRLHSANIENDRLHEQNIVIQQKVEEEAGTEKQNIEVEFRSLLEQVPAAPCIPEAIAYLEECAEKSGIMLMSIYYQEIDHDTVTENDKTSTYRYQNLDIVVKGDYDMIKSFIGRIENEASRIYGLSSIRFHNSLQVIADIDEADYQPYKDSIYYPGEINAEIKIKIFYDNITMPFIES